MSPLMLLVLAGQSTFTVTNASYDGPVERPADARLVWADEFEGHALDQACWVYDTAFNKQGWFNKERQYYSAGRPENIRVANGVLTIEARHEKLDPAKFPDWGGQDYTSARIYSKGPGWTYGFYEVLSLIHISEPTRLLSISYADFC